MSSRALVCLLVLVATQAAGDEVDAPQQMAAIGDLPLVSGQTLYDVEVGYRIAGTLNAERSNVIVFPSWFSGTAGDLLTFQYIGPGLLADTDHFYVITVDSLADGVSTSPSNSERQGGADFPEIAIDDMVTATHELLTEQLGFGHVHAVLGISMGGMQTFQWIGQYPDFMDRAVAIEGSPRMTSYDLAHWQAQDNAIETLRAAGLDDESIMEFIPSVYLLTLWTPDYFVENISREAWPEMLANFKQNFARLNPYDYQAQLKAMMSHDVFADHAGSGQAYQQVVHVPLLVIGNVRDHVVNATPGRKLAEEIGARHVEIDSNCGHLGTTCESGRIVPIVHEFLQ